MPGFPSLSADAERLLQHACTELSRRLHAGESCQAESLLQDYPSLASDPQLALDLILTEFRIRQQLGQRPDPRELLHRFPQWQASLLQRLGSPEPRTTNEDSARTPLHQPLTSAPEDSSSTPLSALPPELGPHQVGDVLGQGGMGVVYRARDQVLDRPVALKVLRSGLLASSEEVQRFYREARASARLRHTHIVPIHGMGMYQGQHCFTMPLLSGGTLTRQLPRLRQDLRAGVALMEKVARAVQAAHEQGVIHRDLKPSNILLDEQGEPHVSDFGLAKLLDAPAEATASGQVLGTPAYMAPEQAAGQASKATAATDVWALGVVLYELLVGRRPFQGQSSSETSWQVLNTEPPRPRALQPRLPRDLQTIVLKCLEKDPARRYVSAAALADDLANWLAKRPIAARPLSLRRRLWRRAQRRPVRFSAIGLVLAALVAIPAMLFFMDPERARESAEARLRRGQPVTLIGEQGPPRWSQWRLNNGAINDAPRSDGAFTISSAEETALLELVRHPNRNYRFSALVLHDHGERVGEVGLFFAYSDQLAGPDRSLQTFCTVGFNDLAVTARARDGSMRRRVQLTLQVLEGRYSNQLPLRFLLYGAPETKGGNSYRKFVVEVTGEAFRSFWEGDPIAEAPLPIIVKQTDALDIFHMFPRAVDGRSFKPFAGIDRSFDCTGALGLYVSHGKASFKQVVIEPLP